MISLDEQAAVWMFLHDLFRSPDTAQWDHLRSDSTRQAYRILRGAFAPELPDDLPLPPTYPEYEQEYLSTFEVGQPSPPCPLIESHWNPDSKSREENVLFYKRFGLTLHSSVNGPPDLLLHQLDFMRHLCRLASSADADKTIQLDQALHDYRTRHLSWVSTASASLTTTKATAWTRDWMALLDACCTSL
jgi:hypothetical protein